MKTSFSANPSRAPRPRHRNVVRAFGAIVLMTLGAAAAAAQPSRVFVAEPASSGNLGGLAGADATCQRLGAAVDPGAKWIAWLSTSGQNARDRLPAGSGPFVRAADGALLAKDLADLTDSSLADSIAPQGSGLNDQPVWTGTAPDGTGTGHNCGDWTKDPLDGTAGGYWTAQSGWTQAPGEPPLRCSFESYLYCFEVPSGPITVDKPVAEVAEQVTATLLSVPAGSGHWITIAPANSSNTVYLTWEWVAKLSGMPKTWKVTMPATPGDYVVRLFLNGGYDLAASRTVKVVAPAVPPAIEAPSAAAPGGTIVATLNNAPRGTSYWIAMGAVASSEPYVGAWQWITALSGDPKTWTTTVPTTPGTYEVRLFLPQADGSHKVVATSDAIAVG